MVPVLLFFRIFLLLNPQGLRLVDPAADAIRQGTIQMRDVERAYRYYIPSNLKSGASLVFVFHGAGGDAMRIRMISGYEWEGLADANNFIVVYPEGYERHWNGCRKMAPYSAKVKNIDDTQFVRQLVDHLLSSYPIDRSRVFAAGLSNGGHMVYRLALEMPQVFRAVAAIGASLPETENFNCHISRLPISVMILNGTEDQINPFHGGEGILPDGKRLGPVVSSFETAYQFRFWAGLPPGPSVSYYPEKDHDKRTSIKRLTWQADFHAEVSLYIIKGGGHNIPQAKFMAPEVYGKTVTEINGPQEIWNFFQRQVE